MTLNEKKIIIRRFCEGLKFLIPLYNEDKYSTKYGFINSDCGVAFILYSDGSIRIYYGRIYSWVILLASHPYDLAALYNTLDAEVVKELIYYANIFVEYGSVIPIENFE